MKKKYSTPTIVFIHFIMLVLFTINSTMAGQSQVNNISNAYAYKTNEAKTTVSKDESARIPEYEIQNVNDNDASISIYPNPATNIVTLNTQGLEGDVSIQLYNLLGKKLLDKKLDTFTVKTKTYSIDHLNSGIYLLQVIDDKGKVTSFKLFKE